MAERGLSTANSYQDFGKCETGSKLNQLERDYFICKYSQFIEGTKYGTRSKSSELTFARYNNITIPTRTPNLKLPNA